MIGPKDVSPNAGSKARKEERTWHVVVVVGFWGCRAVVAVTVGDRLFEMASSDVRVCPVLHLAVRELAAEFGADDACLDLDSHEARLARVHGAWAAWPLDAKFAFHVLAWLRGPGFNPPGLRGRVGGPTPDFHGAAREVVGLGNAGHCGVIALHDRAARALRNAGAVMTWDLPPDVLYYPLGL